MTKNIMKTPAVAETKAVESKVNPEVSAKAIREAKPKPGLASHLAAKKKLDEAIEALIDSGDTDAVRLLNVYSKNLTYRMRKWAKVTIEYVG